MFKTRDGYSITVGDWISDDNDVIYDVKNIKGDTLGLREVLLTDDGDYFYGDYKQATQFDISQMVYEY